MLYPVSVLSLILLFLIHLTSSQPLPGAHPPSSEPLPEDTIPFSTRAHWMRRANAALGELHSPCPFAAFGTAIVNHTDPSSPLGDLVCVSVNQNQQTGNPTLHGEVSAINECTSVLAAKGLSPAEIAQSWKSLSLYTNGEPCPMCASAIRWAGFKECIYGTSIATLSETGWGQISLRTADVFGKSEALGGETRLLKDVLSNETDPYFAWQFQPDAPCPGGCARQGDGLCGVNAKIGKSEL